MVKKTRLGLYSMGALEAGRRRREMLHVFRSNITRRGPRVLGLRGTGRTLRPRSQQTLFFPLNKHSFTYLHSDTAASNLLHLYRVISLRKLFITDPTTIRRAAEVEGKRKLVF